MYSEQHLEALFSNGEIALATTQLAAINPSTVTTPRRIWDHLISTLKLDASDFIKLTSEEARLISEKSTVLYVEEPQFKYADLSTLCNLPEKHLRMLNHLEISQLLTMLAIRKGKDFKAKLLSFLEQIEASDLR